MSTSGESFLGQLRSFFSSGSRAPDTKSKTASPKASPKTKNKPKTSRIVKSYRQSKSSTTMSSSAASDIPRSVLDLSDYHRDATPPRIPDLIPSVDSDSSPDCEPKSPLLSPLPKKERRLWTDPQVQIEYQRQLNLSVKKSPQLKLTRKMIAPLDSRTHERDDAPKRKPISKPHTVKPFTIYHILHDYQTVSLHVRPISWTDQHCDVFKIKWEKKERYLRSLPPTVNPNNKDGEYPQYALDLSSQISMLFAKEAGRQDATCIKSLIWRLFPDRHPTVDSHPDCLMPFWLGGRPYPSAVKVQSMWEVLDHVDYQDCSFTTQSTNPFDSETVSIADTASVHGDEEASREPSRFHARPVLAYIGRDRLNFLRNAMFRVPPGPNRGANLPVVELHKKRALKLRPENADEDAYLAATFIAMAQRHFYPRVTSANKAFSIDQVVPFEDLTLRILSTDNASKDFIVYTATVTKELLHALHSPRVRTMPGFGPLKHMSGLKIKHQHVPSRPVYGLRERLGVALGGLFGTFPEGEVEVWNENSRLTHHLNLMRPPWMPSPPVKQLKQTSKPAPKRKFSEVYKRLDDKDKENGTEGKHEPMVLPFPPMPAGEEQKAVVDKLHDDDGMPVAKRRRSMAL